VLSLPQSTACQLLPPQTSTASLWLLELWDPSLSLKAVHLDRGESHRCLLREFWDFFLSFLLLMMYQEMCMCTFFTKKTIL
jgi:hypothetical protein